MTNMGDLLRGVTEEEWEALLDCAFFDIKMAEEVLELGEQRYPDDVRKIHRLYRFCRRTPELMPASMVDRVYRAHVKELVVMVVRDQPIDLPTRVEMACGLGLVSLDVELADEYKRWLLRHSPLATADTRENIMPLSFGQVRKIERKLVEHFEEFTAWRHAYYHTQEDAE